MTNQLSAPWGTRLDALSTRSLFLVISGPLLVVYLATATWSPPYNIDAFTNVLTAWQLGTEGTFLLESHEELADPEYYGSVAWVVKSEDSAASQYPPGTALLAAPLYALWPEDARLVNLGSTARPDSERVDVLRPPLGPAAITAAFTVAIAIGLLGVTFRQLGAGPGVAVAGAYLAGLGTSAWSVAADQLWQHGPGMLWMALALVLAERHTLAAGSSLGAAILTRPPTAIIAASMGLYASWRERSIRPAVRPGVGALVGLGLFLAYNQLVFGDPSLSAGYGTSFQDRTLSADVSGYATNVFLGLFSPTRGLLVWSPFLLVLLPGLRAAWKVAPPWARGAALGSVLYLLLQYKANQSSGGEGFFAYRYPLEPLVAAAPVLFLSFKNWVSLRPQVMRIFSALAVTSVVIHAIGAVM